MGGGGWKRGVLDSNQGKVCEKERLLVCENGRFLRTVKIGSNKRCFGYENERRLRAKHKTFCKWKTFGLRKRTVF